MEEELLLEELDKKLMKKEIVVNIDENKNFKELEEEFDVLLNNKEKIIDKEVDDVINESIYTKKELEEDQDFKENFEKDEIDNELRKQYSLLLEQKYEDMNNESNNNIGKFLKQLSLDSHDYNILKKEVNLFFTKKKDRKFNIYPISYDTEHMMSEIIYKIIPIMNFIIVRNNSPKTTCRLLEILKEIHYEDLRYKMYRLNGENKYGNDLLLYKISKDLKGNEEKYISLISLFFALQPMKGKTVYPSTVGVPPIEFNQMESGEY